MNDMVPLALGDGNCRRSGIPHSTDGTSDSDAKGAISRAECCSTLRPIGNEGILPSDEGRKALVRREGIPLSSYSEPSLSLLVIFQAPYFLTSVA